MSECRVPSWNNNNNNNLSQQIRQVEAGEEERNRSSSSSHVHHHHHQTHRPPYYVVPISNYEVAELTWENGQLAMHGLTGAGILQPPASKPPPTPTFGDTLESIVHQATAAAPPININPISAATASGGGVEKRASFVKKRMRSSESDQSGRHNISSSRIRSSFNDDQQMVVGGGGGGGATAAERSACASESATFCREKDAGTTTMMTWTSFESPPGTGSFKTHNNKTTDDDSACHDASQENCRDQEMETKGESVRSQSARRSRAALIHNQSERRRRDRINEKMKALQKLVPNASKTDKASMLDEVIVYLKQLQNEVQMMSRNMALPQMMMMNPLAMQQQLQMSLLARMGMGMGMGVGLGMGMGMLDSNTLVRSTSPISSGLISTTPMPSSFLPSHFAMPTAPHPSQLKSSATNPAPAPPPFADPYTSFLAQQAMNMDIYKMAALYRQHQQANQATQATSNSSQPNFIQRE